MKSLKVKLYEWMREDYPAWRSSGEIEDFARGLHYSAENGRRRVRDLVEEGMLEQKLAEGKYALYRFNQNHPKSAGELKDEQTRELLKANGIVPAT